jgi:hypothetical protein
MTQENTRKHPAPVEDDRNLHSAKRAKAKDVDKEENKMSRVESVRRELENLEFKPHANRAKRIQALAEEILSGLRPGRGLLGTPEEEAKLCRKVEDASEGLLFP